MKIIVVVILFCSVLLYAQVPYNQEFQVNSYTTDSQLWPFVTDLKNSDFIIGWTSVDQDGSSDGVYCQLFDSSGLKKGTEFRSNTYTEGLQVLQDVCSLDDGGFVICWVSTGHEYGDIDYGVYAQIFNSDGSKRGSEIQLHTYENSYQTGVQAIGLPDSGFIACWQSLDQDSSGYGVFGQFFNSDGSKRSDEFQVNTYTNLDQDIIRIERLTNSRFIICWSSNGQDGDGFGIFAQIYDIDGNKVGKEFQINTYFVNDQRISDICSFLDGGFVICWDSFNQDGDHFGIYCQLFDSSGEKIGDEFQVNTYIISSQTHPNIVSMKNGGFIVCWMSYEQNDESWGIYGQLFNNDGTKRGSEFHVNNFNIGSQGYPDLCLVDENKFLITWESQYQDGDEKGIFAKFYLKEAILHSLIPFTLLEPIYDSTIIKISPTLKWQQPSSIHINFPWELEYKVYLDNNNDFMHPQIISGIYDTTCVVDSLIPGTTYFWKVLAKNIAGDSLWSSETNAFFVSHDATSIKHLVSNNPESFQLYPNYPNPFNPETTLKYNLPTDQQAYPVKIKIYDALGRLIITLKDELQNPGLHSVKWNGKNSVGQGVTSGIYFYVVEAGKYKATQKMLLLR